MELSKFTQSFAVTFLKSSTIHPICINACNGEASPLRLTLLKTHFGLSHHHRVKSASVALALNSKVYSDRLTGLITELPK